MGGAFLHAFLFSCALLAVGLALRATLRPLRVLYVPAAVVAGGLGFALVQAGLRVPQVAGATATLAKELGGWPGPLIAVVFAGLLLERAGGKGFGEALRRGARSGVLAWIIILGQIAVGLLVYAAAVRPRLPQVPATFGQLLEVSWAGGHGASAAMGGVYERAGFPAGRDLAFFLATAGLVYGVVSGLALVNVAVRRGWTHAGRAGQGALAEDRTGAARSAGPPPSVSGLEPSRDPPPAAYARTRGEVMEPMALQVVILAAAFGVGYGLQRAFVAAAGLALDPGGRAMSSLGNVPLFLFTLLGGLLVREAMRRAGLARLIDPASLQRLAGVAMEFLIVAAVSTMRVESLRAFVVPVALLLAGGAAWSAFCLLVLSPRLLPRAYWFELGLLNYGFSTANTPQGLMLLRIVDPELKSGAAEDYAVAAPLSAPFVGGGVLTFAVLPPLLHHAPPGRVAAGLAVLVVALYAFGRWLARRGGEPAPTRP